MAINGAAEVILRYDDEQDRAHFETLFGCDFRIQAFTSDQAALGHLFRGTAEPSAMVLIPNRPEEHLESPLLAEARDHHPRVLKILMGDAIALNLLVTLLDEQLIDRCFEQPVNPDVIRSHVLTAALTHSEAPPAPAPEETAQGAGPAILLVDDEPTATRYLARQLERMQDEFRVLCANSAEEGLLTLRDNNSDVAVVMTDQRMPGMHGKELLDELRQSHPAVVRILTSAWGEVDVALDAVNEGRIFRYQKKPWHAGELLVLFRKALAHHRALVSAQNSSRSQAEQQFAELRQQRHASLLEHLSETTSGFAAEQAVADFLDTLATIRTLPAQASHLRASRETTLEHELVRDFGDRVRRQLDSLGRAPGTPPLDRGTFDQALADASKTAPGPADPQTPLSIVCQSLTTLLTASGLTLSDLAVTQGEGCLDVTTASELHMYSHLLAPITRLSRPLLDQQTALLLLYMSARLLGGDIDVAGGDQSLRLSLRLPVSPDQGD